MNRKFMNSALITSIFMIVATTSNATLSPIKEDDAICVATVNSIDFNIDVPIIETNNPSPLRTIKGVVLHLEVGGSLAGEVPHEINVLASEQMLSKWGYDVRQLLVKKPGGTNGTAKKLVTYAGISEIVKVPLNGLHAVFSLTKPRPEGGFYLTPQDARYDQWRDANPNLPQAKYAQVSGCDYALTRFDSNGGSSSIYVTGVGAFDMSQPSGLRILNFLASDMLLKATPDQRSLNILASWNPLEYRTMHDNTWINGLDPKVVQAWFAMRFSDKRLTNEQKDNQDILFLRADWGDQAAYARFKAITLKNGATGKWTWLPRQSDPDLVMYVAKKAHTPEIAKAAFVFLGKFPERKKDIFALANSMLGRSHIADQGILECLYTITKNPKINPTNDRGLKEDLSSCVSEAKKATSSSATRSN